jgi:hypothetical protein
MSISLSAPERTREITIPTWTDIIKPESSNLIVGDLRTGKTGLAYWMLEHFSQLYRLIPIVVGFPKNKRYLLPEKIIPIDTVAEVKEWNDAVIFMDEGDIQLPLEKYKVREHMIEFLSLPGQRNQILLIAFHFPRLVMSRYLPYFHSIILKRPPFLRQYASKSKNDILSKMMDDAESGFLKLDTQDIVKNSYVISSKLRWQGMIGNPLPSFWTPELSKAWALGEE